MSKIRKFGGKVYKLVAGFRSKVNAKKVAEEYRKRKFKARVVRMRKVFIGRKIRRTSNWGVYIR